MAKLEPSLMGISAAARALGKCESTVRTLADRAELTSTRDMWGRRLFRRTDVLRFKTALAERAEADEGEQG